MYIVHGPLENMVYFFYRNYHIFSVVRLSYDVKNLGDLRGCYLEGSYPARRDSVFSNNNTEYRIMHGTERES